MQNIFTGALKDTRTEEEKSGDIKFEEVVAGGVNPVNWVEKDQSTWRRFTQRFQDFSGTCVAQTMAKMKGVINWLNNGIFLVFSAAQIYQQRSNRPGAGMIGIEAFSLAAPGTTLELIMPSEHMTDAQIDAEIDPTYDVVSKFFLSGQAITMPTKDIESAASVIQTTGKPVMVWFDFDYNAGEWTDTPQIISANPPDCHSICAVDYALINGKKCLICDDSFGTFQELAGQRIITEDFYAARNVFAAYPMDLKNTSTSSTSTIPADLYHNFSTDLQFSPTFNVNGDVTALQKILAYERYFPTNIAISGYYGAITATAVLAWQKAHNVDTEAVLDSLKGRTVGPETRAALNAIYNK